MHASEELPRVTPALVRGLAEDGCARRLALEHAGDRGTAPAGVRYRVANVLAAHARLAQLETGPPRPDAFTGDPELTLEERAVYDHAVRWYLAWYGDRVARSVDLGDDDWDLARPDLGVRVVTRPPLVLEHDGDVELRMLRLGGSPPRAGLLDDVELRLLLLRLAPRFAGTSVLVSVAHPMLGRRHEEPFAIDEVVGDLDGWLRTELDTVRATIDRDRTRISADCGRCRYVTRCPEHKPDGH